jgi:hypothetical protein
MKYPSRTIVLVDEQRRQMAISVVQNMPLGTEIVCREVVKKRSLDQNALYWAGPLKDIELQAFVLGRQYSAEVWHEQFKISFLPEANNPDLAELVKDPAKYVKWAHTPNGSRVCIGSTTQLTKRGFSEFLEGVYSTGAELGVQFLANPREAAHEPNKG